MKKIFAILFLLCTQLFAQGELKLLTTIHGEKEGDEFSDVDAIGDINGDGFDDFIVGKKNRGSYLKLYFGASPFDTLNCIKFLEGTRKIVYASGCGKGDLNGDGYNDFVINTLYDVNDYRVEIYYGGKDKKIYDNPDLIITNNGWYYSFGARSINGDLNNDGYDDLVITAPNDDFDARGRVYIYLGGKEMDDICDVFLEGKEEFDMFGASAEIIGDVNADGYDELLVGAPQDLKDKGGKAYLFFGGDSIGFNQSIELIGDTT
ncbi:MAG: FG-GAP repeat protein, partial [Ignavibacteriales bacterium]|nr:FG-GAP repeat protein [Ignavibacteriales bacterium]